MVVQREAELLQIVQALRATGRFSGRLHGRQQERHERADDGDDDQQLNQREGAS
jgi:hypothetical protein